ncbi:MAG: dihydroorotase [Candidatus Omnitrophota bacterium]|jgi:dihydroorotase|nr:dihydroorotase [Candidatus Omnitrophota bacterium]
MELLIRNGHVIDPANKIDGVMDIFLKDGKIFKVGKIGEKKDVKTIDAKDMLVLPGLVDMHTHLREPGREDEETIESGSFAAAKGGFTTVCCMPNTEPAVDNQGIVELVVSQSKRVGIVNIYPIGAITVGRKGEALAELASIAKAGAIAFSDDGSSINNSQVMRRALEYSKMLDRIVIAHCEDTDLSSGGVMNEGYTSMLLGLKGIPYTAEATIVARDIELAKMASAKIHIAHVSCKESIGIIEKAKKDGVKVTSETCPHYFTLTEDAVKGFNTNAKVNPPLRTEEDKKAILKALKTGVIDVIATDHAPHTANEKDVEFDYAPFGMIGLELALSLAIMELIDKKVLTWPELVERMSLSPSKILGVDKGTCSIGKDADIIIVDPKKKWLVTKENLRSGSRNTPFLGKELKGIVEYSICKGKIIHTS